MKTAYALWIYDWRNNTQLTQLTQLNAHCFFGISINF